jgi:hypothetical protein
MLTLIVIDFVKGGLFRKEKGGRSPPLRHPFKEKDAITPEGV